MCMPEDIIQKASKVYRKGETTIPKEIRDTLEMRDGDVLVWRLNTKTNHLTMEKVQLSE